MQMTMSQTATPPLPPPTLPPRRPPTLPPRPMAAEPSPLPQVAEHGLGRRLAAQPPPNMPLPLPMELHWERPPPPPPPSPLHQGQPQRAPMARVSGLRRPPLPPPNLTILTEYISGIWIPWIQDSIGIIPEMSFQTTKHSQIGILAVELLSFFSSI